MIRIAVIGAGNHSRHDHGPALSRYRNEQPGTVELAAVCDRDREKAQRYAEAFGFSRTYADSNRMFETESLDAVIAITPVSVTRELVGNLLVREIPLFFEKPPGRNSREARELLEIAMEHDSPHMISFNRRFNPAVKRAHEWLDTATSDRPPRSAITRLLRIGRYEPQHITSTGIHTVDTVCSFLGTPQWISSHRWQSRETGGESCSAQVRFRDDATALFAIEPDAGAREETYELFGPGYSIHINALAGRLRIEADGERVRSWEADDKMSRYVRNGTMDETAAFLGAVERGNGFAPTLTDGVRSLRVAECLDASGKWTVDNYG
jgi:predicted dehydrogenase